MATLETIMQKLLDVENSISGIRADVDQFCSLQEHRHNGMLDQFSETNWKIIGLDDVLKQSHSSFLKTNDLNLAVENSVRDALLNWGEKAIDTAANKALNGVQVIHEPMFKQLRLKADKIDLGTLNLLNLN